METVAAISRRNGAYLIQFMGGDVGDWVEDEQFEAASSLAKAKAITRQRVHETGGTTRRFAEEVEGQLWYLDGTWGDS